jgi:hypothetical protein
VKGQFGPYVPGEGSIYLRMLQERLREVLNELSEREARVIDMRFGLSDGEPKTLNEIGKAYGVSRERIRQIEIKTMSKLRHPKRSSVFKEYYDVDYFPIEDRGLGGSTERGLTYCERHGWRLKPPSLRLTCTLCPCQIYESGHRPQKYCSNACRQAAYRNRIRALSNPR